MATTIGIEEEFVLVDPCTLVPVDLGAQAAADLRDRHEGAVAHEYLRSQIEFATPVCTTIDEAHEALICFRRDLGRWCAESGVIATGSATPFQARAQAPISAGERYARIAGDIAALSGDHQINGLHVHVGLPDRDARVRASNALRPWLPVLLALSANSPFWHGCDTGYDSWRTIHTRRWTTHGIPPVFRDASDYDRTIAELIDIGATSDAGAINWSVRLSRRYPTLEVRICDAQLDATSSAALAAIIRALVVAPSADTAPVGAGVWDAALWHAARHGVRTTLVHPLTGRLAPAADVLRALSTHIAPHLSDEAEEDAVAALLARPGNGADRQRAALCVGTDALADLYRERLVSIRNGSRRKGSSESIEQPSSPGAAAADRAADRVRP